MRDTPRGCRDVRAFDYSARAWVVCFIGYYSRLRVRSRIRKNFALFTK